MTFLSRLGRRLLSSTSHASSVEKGKVYHGFRVKNKRKIEELDLEIIKLEHERTGAAHWHVAREDQNNVFCVAFRTPPSDSTGVPHILEHTTLCGSDKYPVRDPFFKMLNRSMASYMNAWTASEHTAYPFCTANPSDYANLRDVYCDAVFHPKLEKLDFLQEGWRLENQDPKLIDSPLTFKGVVYNEMKGAFSDVESLFAQRLQQHRLPGSIYGHVSGGDPANIPGLTHEQLVEFHRRHYHPSNALFYTYGNLPLEDNLAYLDEKLAPFGRTEKVTISVPEIPSGAKTIETTCPLDPSIDENKQCKMIVSFLMNDVTGDTQESFHLKILSHLLLEGSSAPMYKALIDSNLGPEYAVGTGYDTSTKLATFSVGLQGIGEDDVGLVRETIYRILEECKSVGFQQSRIDAVLHLLELGTKYQSAQFGIGLSHKIISSWVYGIEPEDELSITGKIAKFKEAYAKGGLFEGLIDKYMLKSDSPLTFIMKPCADHGKRLAEMEDNLLKKRVDSLTEADRNEIFETNLKLLKEQEKKDSLESLPCLHFGDVKRETKKVPLRTFQQESSPKIFWRTTPTTNGISFMKMLLPIQNISAEDIPLLPLVCESLTELGVAGKTLEKFDEDVKLVSGGIHSSLVLGRQPWGNGGLPEVSLLIGTHALDRNMPKALELLQEAISRTDFSNLSRIKSILSGNASSMMNSIASSGHAFAMSKASSALTTRGHLDEQLNGLSQANFLSSLVSQANIEEVAGRMRRVAGKILDANIASCRSAVICSDESERTMAVYEDFHRKLPLVKRNSLGLPLEIKISDVIPELIEMPFSTNYAARVYQFNPYNLKESASLAILSKILRSGLLHREIREKGGAYGGGASFSMLHGTFSFFSYRDPNPTNSVAVFDHAPSWFMEHALTEQELLEAKLSVFSGLDAPVEVSQEGLHTFYHGISDVDRQLLRDEIFGVGRDDLRRVAEGMLKAKSHTCIIKGTI